MSPDTIRAIRFIDTKLQILAEIFQNDYGYNEWHCCNGEQTWEEWSQDWLAFVDCDITVYGQKMYQLLSRINIEPEHCVSSQPILDAVEVDWVKVGNVIRSHFRT